MKTLKKTTCLAALAGLASLALLVPAGSAQAATQYHAKWCGQLTSSGYQSMTLKPGQVCAFPPVAVRSMWGAWQVTSSGHGSVCIGVIQYPPGWPNGKALSPTGGNPATDPPRDPYDGMPPHPDYPGYPYTCPTWTGDMTKGDVIEGAWFAYNGFGAVYGEPVMVNFSTATVKTLPGLGSPWGYINYYA
jgi:hypothetical protein